jgi:hypothetical protein
MKRRKGKMSYLLSTEEAREAAKELLTRSYNILQEYGWTKCAYHDPGVGYCCLGAMQAAQAEAGYSIQVYNEACRKVRAVIDEDKFGRLGIVHWNDAPERTKEEVLAVVTTAAGGYHGADNAKAA